MSDFLTIFPDFAKINFSDMKWADDLEVKNVQKTKEQVLFQGKLLNLELSSELFGEWPAHILKGKFTVENKSGNYSFNIVIQRRDNNYVMTTSVLKNDENGNLPKGMNELVYDRIFSYAQRISNINDIVISHEALRDPTASNQPFSEEQWRKAFSFIVDNPIYKETPHVNASGETKTKWIRQFAPETQSAPTES